MIQYTSDMRSSVYDMGAPINDMGAPDVAPYPHRSERPGEAVALLDTRVAS